MSHDPDAVRCKLWNFMSALMSDVNQTVTFKMPRGPTVLDPCLRVTREIFSCQHHKIQQVIASLGPGYVDNLLPQNAEELYSTSFAFRIFLFRELLFSIVPAEYAKTDDKQRLLEFVSAGLEPLYLGLKHLQLSEILAMAVAQGLLPAECLCFAAESYK